MTRGVKALLCVAIVACLAFEALLLTKFVRDIKVISRDVEGLVIPRSKLHGFKENKGLTLYTSHPFPNNGDGKPENTTLYKDGKRMTQVNGWGQIDNEDKYLPDENSSVIIGRRNPKEKDFPTYTLDYVKK